MRCLPFRSPHPTRLALLTALTAGISSELVAAPVGGNITGGAGDITQSASVTTITQNSDRLAIDWQSFDIAVDERVQFVQPDTDSIALNRILSNSASQILGQLDANGQVLLVNPNGIIFGEDAHVNVGGLIASGLDIRSEDFLNGELAFKTMSDKAGFVINRGIIEAATGGNVALLGRRVDNAGLISAELGSITLAAGREAVLTFDPQGLLGVRVSKASLQKVLGDTPAVSNTGELIAAGGQVLLNAQVSADLFSAAVNHGELTNKTDVQLHADGSFTLGAGAHVVNSGLIDVSSNTNTEDPARRELDVGKTGMVTLAGSDVQHSGNVLAMSFTEVGVEEYARSGTVRLLSTGRVWVKDGGTISVDAVDGSYAGVDQGWDYGLYEAGSIYLLGKQVGITGPSVITASSVTTSGNIVIGGELTDYALVGDEAMVFASGFGSSSENYGSGGTISIHSNHATLVDGGVHAHGIQGRSGGSVTISSEGTLGFSGMAGAGAAGNEDHEGETGHLTLSAPNLLITPQATPHSISGASLHAGVVSSNVHLLAKNGIATVGNDSITITPYHTFNIRAVNDADSTGTIDLGGLVIDPGDPYERVDSIFINLEADSTIIAPQVGFPLMEDDSARMINVSFQSHSGDIIHRSDIHTYGGNYSADAGGDIRFENGAELHMFTHNWSVSGYTHLKSGGDIDLAIKTNGDRFIPSDLPLVTVQGTQVAISANSGLESAEIVAETLSLSAEGPVSATAVVGGVAYPLSSPDGGQWLLPADPAP